jgi:hypothetical protein
VDAAASLDDADLADLAVPAAVAADAVPAVLAAPAAPAVAVVPADAMRWAGPAAIVGASLVVIASPPTSWRT